MKNHYIQKKFIESFCGTSGILVYNILKDKILPKLNSAKNIACENDFYQFKNIDYPDEQIEKDLKAVEDKGISIIVTIAKEEKLPSIDGIFDLITYLYYQSKRIQWRKSVTQEISSKLNLVDRNNNYDDMFIMGLYNHNYNRQVINKMIALYDFYLLKVDEPIFFITDCFCSCLESGDEQVVPLTSNFALFLRPKSKKPILTLQLKEKMANTVTINDYIIMMPMFASHYKQFAFGSYTLSNCRLIPKLYKLLQKML